MRFRAMFAAALGMALILAASLAWAKLEGGHTVKTVKFAGAEVHLEDGSIWKVPNRTDWEITYNWLPGQPLGIRDGKSLVNLNTGEEVDVKKVKGPGAPESAPAPGAASGPVKVPTVTSRGVVTKLETPAAAQSPAAAAATSAQVSNMEKRLDSLEDKLQVLDWRLRQIEEALKARPKP